MLSIYFLKTDSIRFNAENLVTITNPVVLPSSPNSMFTPGSSDVQDSVLWVQAQRIAQVKIAGRVPFGISNAVAAPQLRLESFDS